MKKFLLFLLLLVFLCSIAVASCPDRDAHKDAIMAVVKDGLTDVVTADSTGKKTEEKVFSIFLGKTFLSEIGGIVLNEILRVDNHFVYSVGILTQLDGTEKMISVGIFGHVFTFKREDVAEAIKNFNKL